MVDIKELMQRYAILNNPDVREITTMFGALIVGLGIMGLAVAGAVTWAQDGGAPDATAAHADNDSEPQLGDETKDCVLQENADEWREEHSAVLMSNRLLDVEEMGDRVCFTYVK